MEIKKLTNDRYAATHYLKTDSEPFKEVLALRKKLEIRKNDRNFQVGDILHLQETRYTGLEMVMGAPLEYTGRVFETRITHIVSGYGLKDGHVALSMEPV